MKHRGTIYLRQMDTEAKLKAEANKSETQQRMCSWGFKFEQFILDDLRKGGLISEGILIPVRSSIRLLSNDCLQPWPFEIFQHVIFLRQMHGGKISMAKMVNCMG